MTEAEQIADVLGQAVPIGPTPAQEALGEAVMASLRARASQVLLRPNLSLATTAELIDELRTRVERAGLLDQTLGGET